MRQDANVVNRIKEVQSFPSLLKFLRDDLDWPITSNDVEDLTFDYSPDELGFDKKMAVKVRSIKQLRPLVKDQPWGIFYIDFEPKRLPVGALRRLLRSLVVKKRGGGDGSQATWNLDDLLFISFHGEESRRTVAFAHFHEREKKQPQLRTFYWDQGETEFASVLESLGKLNWPQYAGAAEMAHVWRQYWGAAFRVGHGEVIRDSKALSKKLAQVALKIRQHVFDLLDAEDADKGPLHRLFASFKKALLHDLDEQRFADVLAQTFTYGLLAAKAEIGTKTPLEPGHLAEQIPATNPLLRELFEEFQHLTGVGLDKLDEDLGDLGVDELVDLLNTVDVDEALKNFGRTTMSGQEDPVVHFYEEFLKDYDKEQKVERGVFYTPKPVVSFIVRSVHEILQKEFGLEDGLASTDSWDDMVAKHEGLAKPEGIRGDEPFVQILDPAVGTGTFLEACIQLIYDTMAAKWNQAGQDVKTEWNRYVPEHLLPRLHGFELMMAPYVVCHMKLGLRLKELGYDFQSGERLRVYLTNTLEPPVQKQETLIGLMDAVAHEAHQANAVKKELHFTVLIGNPPYSGISSNMTAAAKEWVRPFRYLDGQLIREKSALQFEKNINDDYVKFFGFALASVASCGVLGFISNNTYLDSVTLRGFRQNILQRFHQVSVVDLHGDADKRETASDGEKDANVFDIKKGVSILLAHSPLDESTRQVCRVDLLGTRQYKYDVLADHCLASIPTEACRPVSPGYYLVTNQGSDVYQSFTPVDQLFRVTSTGIESGKDDVLTAFTLNELKAQLATFAQGTQSAVEARFGRLSGWGLTIFGKRSKLAGVGSRAHGITQFMFGPMDFRQIVAEKEFLKTNSMSAGKHLLAGDNLALVVMRQVSYGGAWSHALVTSCIPNNRSFYSTKGKAAYFPIDLVWAVDSREPNLTPAGTKFVAQLQADGTGGALTRRALAYIYCILSSPDFRSTFDEELRRDFPRIPWPEFCAFQDRLISLGEELIALHTFSPSVMVDAPRRFRGSANQTLGRPVIQGSSLYLDAGGTSYFQGVARDVWEFEVAGYKPTQKWLKDRKGRTLTEADIRHYEQMLYAIEETIRIMAEIDEVIEAHGGWPGAFQGGASVD